MFDCHFHLDESLTPVDKLLESMDAHGIRKMGLMGRICGDLCANALTKLAAPIFRAGICSNRAFFRRTAQAMYRSWVKDNGQVDVGGRLYPTFIQPDNDSVMKAVAAHPERFAGWIFVNPAGPSDPVEEIQRCLQSPGMIGVKAHSFWHAYALSRLVDAAALCAEKGMPLIIHIGLDDFGDFRLLPEKFPSLTVIYAHAGIPYQQEIWDYARQKPNVYMDLAGTGYVDAKISKAAVIRAGADKCLFGTDGPYFHHKDGHFDFGPQLAIFQSLNLGKEEQEMVGSRNFENILSKRR